MKKNKNVVYGAVVVAVVAAALVVWSMWDAPNNANFPEGTDWLCEDPRCATHFNLSMEELGEFNKKNFGQRVKCPKDGKPAVRAEKCAHCGKWHPRPHEGYRCPFCGKENAPPKETASAAPADRHRHAA